MEFVRYIIAVDKGPEGKLYVCPSHSYGHYWDVSADPFVAFRTATLAGAREAAKDLAAVFAPDEVCIVRLVMTLEPVS